MQVNVSKVGPVGGVDLNRAMSTVYNETRAFLMHNYDLTEDMVTTPLTTFYRAYLNTNKLQKCTAQCMLWWNVYMNSYL